jgi:hypothetical protein
MFRPLTWPQRFFLIAVALAAISSHLGVSIATSVTLVLYGVWDWRAARAGRPVSVATHA